jgi:hypothetical protein
VVNVWDSGGNVPMNLTVSAGAYDATMDLSGLPIRRFTVQDGASEVEIRFDAVNPEDMDRLSYQTGASEIKFIGLANANFDEMNFDGGAGKYSFDFSGDATMRRSLSMSAGHADHRSIWCSCKWISMAGGQSCTWCVADRGDIYVNPGDGFRCDQRECRHGDVHLANQ